MDVDGLMFLGWVAVPLIAYIGGTLALTRTTRTRAARPADDAVERLAMLHRQGATGRVTQSGPLTGAAGSAPDVDATASHTARQP